MPLSTSKEPDISFVIPCYQSDATVALTLESVLSQSTQLTYEVLVVESSSEATVKRIEEAFPAVRVLASRKRLFAGAARNLGVRSAKGSLLAFLDADIVVPPEWLESLARRLKDEPRLRMVGCAVANGNPHTLSSRILHWIEFSEFLPGAHSGLRDYLSSSNLMLRTEDFTNVGGFDKNLAMAEDLRLSMKLGRALFFDGAATVYHHYQCNWPQAMKHLRELGYWSGYLRGTIETKGSSFRSLPIAGFAIPPVRCALVIRRVWQSSPRAGLYALLHSPGLLLGLFHWARGFYRGLKA